MTENVNVLFKEVAIEGVEDSGVEPACNGRIPGHFSQQMAEFLRSRKGM